MSDIIHRNSGGTGNKRNLASNVFFGNGSDPNDNVEKNLGMIKGMTSDLTSQSIDQALSAYAGFLLNNKLNQLNNNKQNKLIEGENITLTPQQNGNVVISASGGSTVGELNDLTDVNISSPTDGNALIYDSENNEWVNGEISGGGNVDDVVINGQSIVTNKVASFKNYVELTRSEYDALPDTKYTDGILYCIKDSGATKGNYFSPIIYSLAEREVGVWTDGKPLYQRIVTFTVDSTSGYKRVTTDIANAETVLIDFSASYYLGGGLTKLPCVGYLGSGADVSYLNSSLALLGTVVDNYLCIDYRAGQNVFGASAVVTVRYTKTTDNPGTGKWTTQGVPAHHYSTDEQVIGTWVDGKPLYEKTYYISSNSRNIPTNLLSDLNIFMTIECSIMVYHANNLTRKDLTYNNSTKLLSNIPDNVWINHIVVKYTKSS